MSKFENLSKEELLKLVEKQEKELASKKYGLVWDREREPEQVVLDCANNLPVLKRVKGKEIKTDDSEDNILIEGDSYHTLTVLNYTHKEKIDVIYIDPPYNTGNKDFIYNDRYVDKTDSHPHSKWLNFMEKRLNLAERLLKDTGVIFISIDDNEMAQLKLLCDKIFGKDNFIGMAVRKRRDSQANLSKNISVIHEYVVIYGNSNLVELNKISPSINEDDYKNPDKDPRGKYVTMPCTNKGGSKYEIITPTGNKHLDEWRFKQITYLKLVNENRIVFPRDGRGKPRYKLFLKEKVKKGTIPNSWWDELASNQQASIELKNLFNNSVVFNNPKPTELIKFICSLNGDKKSIVLDFMAGSGTTGHAVLALNKEDNGNRKFILCTNNEFNGFEKKLKEKGMSEKEIQEYGICRRITYPRLKKVIKGYKKNGKGEKVEGLGGNLQYFRTALVKETKSKIQVKIDLTQKCAGMLCVKENIFNLETKQEDFKIFSSNKKDKFLCVYFNFLENSFEDFLVEIQKLKGKKIIYMFSLENKIKKSLFDSINDKEIIPIPQAILDIYEELVRKNIPIKKEIIFLELEKARKKVFEEKEKDDGAKNLRIVLEKILQKIAQQNEISFLGQNGKEEKISITNDKLKSKKIISQVIWEENKTYLTIGNDAMHGKYDDFDLHQVENFYKHTQNLINKFNF